MKRRDDIAQRTEAWHQIRKGRITGTTLKSIMGTSKARKGAMYEVIAERLTVGVETDYESDIDRGNRLEPEAIAAFEFETGLSTESTGFCQQDENDQLGYSPDAIVRGTGDSEDVEVKCPRGKGHVMAWLTDEVPEEYRWQVVQAFVVNPGLKKRYFVSYNPNIPAHPIHIIEVKREDVAADIAKAEANQRAFLEEVDAILGTIIKI